MIISKFYHLQIENSFKNNVKNVKKKHNAFDEILAQHIVKKGETLYNISKNYLLSKGTKPTNQEILKTVKIISKLNNIKNPNLIFPGQVILFPNSNQFASKESFIMPVNGVISSKYGMRLDPFTKQMRFHSGIDIAAPTGTPVKAAEAGEVIFSGSQKGYGNIVIIKHNNGLITKYAHNSKNLVKVGDIVKKGETISLVGSSGRATGPHLHFEVRLNNKTLNPLNFLYKNNFRTNTLNFKS